MPLLATVVVKGRWSALLRRLDVGLSLATCAAMAWTVLDGPVFMTAESDRTVKFIMVLIAVFVLIDLGVKLVRSVRPAPDQRIQGWR